MSKIIAQYADQVERIGLFPTIALLIFMTSFTMVLWHVKTMRREDLKELSNLPLDLSEEK